MILMPNIWISNAVDREITKIVGAAAYYNGVKYTPGQVVADLLKIKDVPKKVQQRLSEEKDEAIRKVLAWVMDLCLTMDNDETAQNAAQR